jgi:YbgC/YbaW family acyl-CoA thioester hydrolase
MVHAARYYEYFEEAFIQWLEQVGLPYADLRRQGVDLAIVDSSCVHREPARLDDRLDIAVLPTGRGSTSLTIEFEVRRAATPLARGRVVYVATSHGEPTPLPPLLRDCAPAARTPLSRLAAEQLLGRLHAAQAELYRGGDDSPLRAVLAADIVWHVPGRSPIAGTYRGADEVIGYMSRRRDLAAGTFEMHPRELLVGDRHVASITEGTADIGGHEHSWMTVGLYRIEASRIAECVLLPFDQAAFDTIWNPP